MALNELPSNASLKEAVAQSENINTEISTLKTKLKTNLVNKGVTATDSDKMSSLIDNVGDIELGKKYASGKFGYMSIKNTSNFNLNLSFVPSIIFVCISSASATDDVAKNIYISNLSTYSIDNPLMSPSRRVTGTITNITSTGFTITMNHANSNFMSFSGYFNWYAFE